jgi:predicted GNAT superfamily acetyltransferase
VTVLAGTPDGATNRDVVLEAADLASAAAAAAGLRVCQLDEITDLQAVRRLFDQIWGPDGSGSVVTTELLRALSKAGSYVGGAFEGAELVGASIGFFAPPAQAAMHSHITGVSSRMQGREVGFALKVHQRAWALGQGVHQITWTFDPLVARNAHFNLGKLAADPVEYLENFYGRMDDRINGGQDTDRLLVRWLLDSERVATACSARSRPAGQRRDELDGAHFALQASPGGWPVAGRATTETVLVAVPRDIEGLRALDGACAASWRSALRETLGGLLAEGARIADFDRSGWYVVERNRVQ